MKTIRQAGARGRAARRGIALILVLGMLALLLILGVAFSVTMRVERSGAGNYAGVVLSKQLAWAALAEAIQHIDTAMGTNGQGSVYPPFDVLATEAVNEPSVQLAWGEVLDYLPASVTSTVQSAQYRPHWAGSAEEGGVVGRYAYSIVDCSGFLDANVAGGSNRMAGFAPQEICLRNLSDMNTEVTPDEATNLFVTYRANDVRYETLQELAALQEGYGFATNKPPANFMVFSHYPRGWLTASNGVLTNQVYVGGNVQSLLNNQAAIKTALVNAGIDGTEAGSVFSNLVDYIDEDSIPGNLGGAQAGNPGTPCTELVPMVNELVMTGAVAMVSVGGGPPMIQAGVAVVVEWFFPFIKPASESFTVARQVSVTLSNVTTGVGSATAVLQQEIDSGYNPGVDVQWYNTLFNMGDPGANIPGLSVPGEPGQQVKVSARIRVQIKQGGQVVDAAPWPITADDAWIDLSPAVFTVGPGVTWFGQGKSCVDPRFNWQRTSPPWMVSPPTPGTTNTVTRLFLQMAAPQFPIDRDTSMYVSNSNRLYSVGELGHLLQGGRMPGDHFRTIRLFDLPNGDRHKVFARFTVHADQARRGLVNINTRRQEALRAVFRNMAKGYPGSGEVLTDTGGGNDVDTIVGAVMAGGPYRNPDEVGALDWRGILGNGWNDAERDAAIAYSCGLLGTRQNLFTILVAAGPFSRGLGLVASGSTGNWLGTQRAVAVVWRDPFPNEDGVHECFVRYFKWLND